MVKNELNIWTDPETNIRFLKGIPIDQLESVIEDPVTWLRDVAALASPSIHPFFERPERLVQAFGKDQIDNPFDDDTIMFTPGYECQDNHRHYIHFDLAINDCSCGIAMAHSPGMVRRTLPEGTEVDVPYIVVDFLGRVQAKAGDEIDLDMVTQLPLILIDRGFDVAMVTFDRFNSRLSMQKLRSVGVKSALLSIKRTGTVPILDHESKDGVRLVSTKNDIGLAWRTLRDVFNQGRISMPYHPEFLSDAAYCEKDELTGMVRKANVQGALIDMVEALAGAVLNVVNNESPMMYYQPGEMLDRSELDDLYSQLLARGGRSEQRRRIDIPQVEDFGSIYGILER